jgi:hypothetical protein
MDLLRIDVVSIYDLRYEGVGRIPWPLLKHSDSLIASRLKESFSWIFYGEQLQGFDSYDLSGAVPNSVGAAVRINRQSRVGSFLIWRMHDGQADPLAFKAAACGQSDQDLSSIEPLLRGLRGDRVYPFVSVQANTKVEDLDDFAASSAVELGRLLTSDLEGERPSTLKKYIEVDLSLRAYEKLFLRWTEALAVYARLDSVGFFETSMFRAVQIFEHCVLGQVSLVSALERMDRFSRRLALVTPRKWLRARALFISLADAEFVFAVYPRTQSVEANRLLAAAHSQFGLSNFLTSAKARGAELRDQFEWAKAQTLGLIVVATYLLDKIIGWDKIKLWLWTILQHR